MSIGVVYPVGVGTREARRSGWSLQVGTALGIPIRVHFTFALLLVWFGATSAGNGDDVALALAFLLLVFGSVLLHELGHAVMARRFGVRTRDIVLYPIGGVARLENIPGGQAELLIALAGPAVNLLLAVLLVVGMLTFGVPLGLSPKLLTFTDVVIRLLLANLLLFVFNLIPAFPMDGGRVLRALLTLTLGSGRATEIAAAIGQGIAILFGIAGILLPNILLMLIALFVFVGASQEAFVQRQLTAVRGKAARDAMVTRFETLAPQDSLEYAARQLVATHQQDFPVIDAWSRVVGLLPRPRLLQALEQLGGGAAVLEVMERQPPIVAPEVNLDHVLQALRTKPDCPVLVLDHGRLVGVITLPNLTEYIELTRRAPGAARSASSGALETRPPADDSAE